MNKKIFISSTIYDLIDIRSELCELLKNVGLDPIMSDMPGSNFEIESDSNSIETCLLNLEKCDHIIFIFSQRYGPSLEKAGFKNYSATHLEYLHAKKLKKNIHVYIRDRLEADYAIHKKNKDKNNIKFSWVNQENLRIFEVLKKHSALSKKISQSNWYKIFKDSIDLKEIIRNDFNLYAAELNIIKLLSKNEFPLLQPNVDVELLEKNSKRKLIFTVTLTNLSKSPAFNLYTEWPDKDNNSLEKTELINQDKNIIAPNQQYSLCFVHTLGQQHTGIEKELLLRYSNAFGYEITEIYEVCGQIQPAVNNSILRGCTLKERKFSLVDPFKVEINK